MQAKHRAMGARRWVHAMAMVSLTPLLLALWAGQVEAVTLEGARAILAARRCAVALEGLAVEPGALADAAALEAAVPEPAPWPERGTAVAWAEPDLSRRAILRLTRAAADRTAPTSAQLSESMDRGGPAAGAPPAAAPEAPPAGPVATRKPTAAEQIKPVTQLRPYAPQWGEARARAAGRARVRFAWWHALPLLPGLLALAVSMRGLARTRRRRRGMAYC